MIPQAHLSKSLWTKVSMLEAKMRKSAELGHRGTVKANDSKTDTSISHQALGLNGE